MARRRKKGVSWSVVVVIIVLLGLAGFGTYKTITGNPTTETGTFHVSVTTQPDSAGNSQIIRDASVVLQNPQHIDRTAVFETPEYWLRDVPTGPSVLTITAPGYATYTDSTIVITSGANPGYPAYLDVAPAGTSLPETFSVSWLFDEASWTTDSSGAVKSSLAGYDGIVKAGASQSAQGLGGKSLWTDGTAGYAEISSFSLPTGGPISVTFWMRANSTNLQNSALFSVGTGNVEPHRFSAYLWSDKKFYWDYGNPSGAGRLEFDFTPYLDRWVQVVLVSTGNGGAFKGIYINGVLVASATASDGPDQALTSLNLGRGFAQGTTYYYKGYLDSFSIAARVLSASDISTAYASQRIQLSTSGQGLVARWKFDEISVPATVGAVSDFFGMSPGTAKGGVTNVDEGIGGRSFVFDGINDEVQISNAGVLSPKSGMALLGWFKTNNLSKGDVTGSWISKRDSYVFGPQKDGSVSFYVFANGQWNEIRTAAVLVKEGVWQQWAATYTGSALSIYLNGTLVKSQSLSGALGTSGDLYMGHDAVTGVTRFFNGSIDEVGLYDRALSAEEIGSLYSLQRAALKVSASTQKISVSDCGVLGTPGTYVVTKSFSASLTTCLSVTADNVLIEGNGFTLRPGVGAMTAISAVNRQNVTVRTIGLDGFRDGILFTNVSGSLLWNVTAVNMSRFGVVLNESSSNMVSKSTFDSDGSAGMYFEHSKDTTVSDGVTFAANGYGVEFLRGSVGNTVRARFINNLFGAVYNDSSSASNTVVLLSVSDSGNVPVTPLIVERAQLASASGYQRALAVGETVSFKLNATDFHNLTVTALTAGVLRLTLKSQPITFTLVRGATYKADIDGDKLDDVSVTWVSTDAAGKVVLTLKTIQGAGSGNSGDIDAPADDSDSGSSGLFKGGNDNSLLKNVSKSDTVPIFSTPVIIGILVGIIVLVVAIWAVWFYMRDSRRAAEESFFSPSPPESHQQPAPYS